MRSRRLLHRCWNNTISSLTIVVVSQHINPWRAWGLSNRWQFRLFLVCLGRVREANRWGIQLWIPICLYMNFMSSKNKRGKGPGWVFNKNERRNGKVRERRFHFMVSCLRIGLSRSLCMLAQPSYVHLKVAGPIAFFVFGMSIILQYIAQLK